MNLCEQLSGQPERLASFVVDLAGHSDVRSQDGSFTAIPEPQRLANWNCLTRTLNDRGVKEIEPYRSSANVVVIGTWEQIKDLRDLSLVTGIEAGCRGKDICNHCEALSPQQCTADAFCSLLGGAPVDASRMCVLAPVAVGCARTDQACGDAISFAKDPQGQCWQFGSTCVPKTWQADASDCKPAEVGHLESCP